MSALNRAAVRRDIEASEAELYEIEQLKEEFRAKAEAFARAHSGMREKAFLGEPGWRDSMPALDDWLDDVFADRVRRAERDREEDEVLLGSRS